MAAVNGNPEAGTQIGPYHLLQVLGEGGMGTVYLAEQREPVRRRVALKVIKLGMDSKAVLARFDAERIALSMMEHGCIAKVLDAGVTARGQPYFVMEYVKGVPITDYCDQHKLPLRARIELLQQVCAGVQHAHLKGVMHRDLKPSNVLVTVQDGKPMPKIIDFGLAKAVDHRLVEATLFTEQGAVLGTPEYMSPEQAGLGGLDVDTRTDVYSLGVLLFELLIGDLPFPRQALRRAGILEMQRVIREQEPQKPSTRITNLGDGAAAVAALRGASAGELGRRLRGDLDWITLKALEKDRTRRYETAQELAADLQRHLDFEPVRASPPGIGYRLHKFARRYRVQCLAAGTVALALVGGTVGTGVGFAEASAQARAAQQNLLLAEQRAQRIESMLAKEREFNEANRVYALVTRLDQAKALERDLHPAAADGPAAMRDWLSRHAEPLLAQVPELTRQLARMRSQHLAAVPDADRRRLPGGDRWLELHTEMQRETDPNVRADYQQEIDTIESGMAAAAADAAPADAAHLHDTLTRLLADLQRFAGEGGAVARVRSRLRMLETLSEVAVREARAAWDDAIAAIAASDGVRASTLYRHLVIRPQFGLVPCGMDPESRLWEFVHLPTAADGRARLDRDPQSGRLLVAKGNGIVLVLLPGGRLPLEQGTEADPRHLIDLEPFFLSKWEMTEAQWARARGASMAELRADHAEYWPATAMRWKDADSTLRAWGLALPTELQWEYACRGNTVTRWWTGSTAASLAGGEHVGEGLSVGKIGRMRPNPFGLFDMGGNVLEWCADPGEPYGTEQPGDGARPDTLRSGLRIARGGAAGASADAAASGRPPHESRSFFYYQPEEARALDLGLRPARMLVR
jgi:serine/threonine protein kinase/formylglycine-generating enzyme required for sulfatase activity